MISFGLSLADLFGIISCAGTRVDSKSIFWILNIMNILCRNKRWYPTTRIPNSCSPLLCSWKETNLKKASSHGLLTVRRERRTKSRGPTVGRVEKSKNGFGWNGYWGPTASNWKLGPGGVPKLLVQPYCHSENLHRKFWWNNPPPLRSTNRPTDWLTDWCQNAGRWWVSHLCCSPPRSWLIPGREWGFYIVKVKGKIPQKY